MSEILEKMGNPMPFERVMGPSRQSMENYGDLQPIARRMKPALWVPSENLPSGLLPNEHLSTLKERCHLPDLLFKPVGTAVKFLL